MTAVNWVGAFVGTAALLGCLWMIRRQIFQAAIDIVNFDIVNFLGVFAPGARQRNIEKLRARRTVLRDRYDDLVALEDELKGRQGPPFRRPRPDPGDTGKTDFYRLLDEIAHWQRHGDEVAERVGALLVPSAFDAPLDPPAARERRVVGAVAGRAVTVKIERGVVYEMGDQ